MNSADTNKKPLVVFSGGMDSAYMLLEYLRKGDVHVCYVINGQHWNKPEVELEARKKLIPLLEFETGHKVLSDTVITIGNANDYTPVIMGSRRASNSSEIPDVAWGQAFRWLYALNFVADGKIHSEVALGYLMGDQIMGKMHQVKKAWDCTCSFTKQHPIPLVTPLEIKSKDAVLRDIPKWILEHTWVCDTPRKPGDEVIACGNCEACATSMKTTWLWEHIYQTKLADTIKSAYERFMERRREKLSTKDSDSQYATERLSVGVAND